MCQFFINRYREPKPIWDDSTAQYFNNSDIIQLHKSLPEYLPTPLIRLPELAKSLGIKQLFVKDESHRFGLKAFKGLGASYAIYRTIKKYFKLLDGPRVTPDKFYQPGFIRENEFIFCTATDGNHGRAVAWAARKLDQKAVIYMPSNTVRARIENIESEGAEVIIVDGNYDTAVKRAFEEASKNDWQIISDTSWPGYDKIPKYIMAGYVTLFREIHQQLDSTVNISAILIQAGVGALAATASWFYNNEYQRTTPKLISVEPIEADCMLQSIKSKTGAPVSLSNDPNSIMAGLNCGTPSPAAWPFIKTGFDMFMTVADEYCVDAMQRYYYPSTGDPQIISGESGASSLAGLIALYSHPAAKTIRTKLQLDENSTILLINTEGDTDPIAFKTLIQK